MYVLDSKPSNQREKKAGASSPADQQQRPDPRRFLTTTTLSRERSCAGGQWPSIPYTDDGNVGASLSYSYLGVSPSTTTHRTGHHSRNGIRKHCRDRQAERSQRSQPPAPEVALHGSLAPQCGAWHCHCQSPSPPRVGQGKVTATATWHTHTPWTNQ